MKTATGLSLLAFGAILAFAVNGHVPGFNLAAAGWILMLTGAVGLCVPARAAGWLRRRVVLHGPRGLGAGPAEDGSYPPQLMRDPAALAAKILQDAQVLPPATRELPASQATGTDLAEAE